VVTQVANMNSDKIYDIVLAVMQVKLITVIWWSDDLPWNFDCFSFVMDHNSEWPIIVLNWRCNNISHFPNNYRLHTP
jgi:hypothetical protein